MLKTSLPLSSTLQVVKDNSETQSALRISTADVTNYGGGSIDTNTAFGASALGRNSTGSNNTAIGTNALFNNNASNNTAVGYQAGFSNTSGAPNTFIGYQAGYAVTNATNAVIIGGNAADAATGGNGAVIIGQNALGVAGSLGTDTIAIGRNAMGGVTSSFGSDNCVIGANSLSAAGLNLVAARNTALGNGTLSALTLGFANTAIGWRAGNSLTAGTNNVIVGYNAQSSVVSGTNGIAIGYNARCGANSTVIGSAASSSTFTACVVLGNLATATGDNQFVVGSAGANAGAIDTAAVTPTKRWKVKINGVDYYIALEPA
jgi:hypothetical protein